MKYFSVLKDNKYYKINLFGIKITFKRNINIIKKYNKILNKLITYIHKKKISKSKIYLDKEFDRIWKKIENRDNFALMRVGDGERSIMTGNRFTANEGWVSPDSISKLGYDILETLKLDNKNIIYGISCPCCDRESYYWYISRINKNMDITFANIFVNANYKKFSEKFLQINRKTVLIANYRAKDKKIGNLDIQKFYPVGDDCINFWKNEGEALIKQIILEIGNENNLFFAVSAGPMSEPIIAALYENNPNNTYIDFGSSIDIFIHEKATRGYHEKNSETLYRNCWMYDRNKVSFDISVVLTLYKRKEYLKQQLDAILNQSLKPKEIILFQDETDPVSNLAIEEDIKKSIDIHIKSSKNIGVWGRFSAALLSKSYYVCVFDDDTIPGKRWFENCHSSMIEKEGLYVTVGITNINIYTINNVWQREHLQVGWVNKNEDIKEVAYGGHSWFLKRDWLGAFWIDSYNMYNLKTCAEDMYLSYQLKKYFNINTYVPPHPDNKYDFFGSNPNFGLKYGSDTNALWRIDKEENNKIEALKFIIDNGGFRKFLL